MIVHPTALVDPSAVLADGVDIGPWSVVGPGVTLSEGVRLSNHAVVDRDTLVGPRTVIGAFAVVGGDPQHRGYRGEPVRLEIGADCVIREHVTINRGTPAGGGLTRIGSRVMMMTGAHAGHDCQVGDDVTFANSVALGGHVAVGDGAFLGGLCAVHQFGRIGTGAMIGGGAMVTRDVIPYAMVQGSPAHLIGLNVVGLKRRGVGRDDLKAMVRAYKDLFERPGIFAERLEAMRRWSDRPAAFEPILDFIAEGHKRPLCLAGD